MVKISRITRRYGAFMKKSVKTLLLSLACGCMFAAVGCSVGNITVIYKLVNTLLTELAYGNDNVVYPLSYTVDIVSYACTKILSHLGLDIIFDVKYENADSTFVNFKTLTLLLSNFILLAAEVSDSHIIYASVEEDLDGDVIFRFPLTVKKPNTTIPLGGAGGFTDLLPGRSVDLYFFERICKSSRYHFDFTQNPKEKDNLLSKIIFYF